MAGAASHFPIGINKYDQPQGRSLRPFEALHDSTEAVSNHGKKRSPCRRLFVDLITVSFICIVNEPGKARIRSFLYKYFPQTFTIFFEFSSKTLLFSSPAQLYPFFFTCTVALKTRSTKCHSVDVSRHPGSNLIVTFPRATKRPVAT